MSPARTRPWPVPGVPPRDPLAPGLSHPLFPRPPMACPWLPFRWPLGPPLAPPVPTPPHRVPMAGHLNNYLKQCNALPNTSIPNSVLTVTNFPFRFLPITSLNTLNSIYSSFVYKIPDSSTNYTISISVSHLSCHGHPSQKCSYNHVLSDHFCHNGDRPESPSHSLHS